MAPESKRAGFGKIYSVLEGEPIILKEPTQKSLFRSVIRGRERVRLEPLASANQFFILALSENQRYPRFDFGQD